MRALLLFGALLIAATPASANQYEDAVAQMCARENEVNCEYLAGYSMHMGLCALWVTGEVTEQQYKKWSANDSMGDDDSGFSDGFRSAHVECLAEAGEEFPSRSKEKLGDEFPNPF